MLPYAIFMKNPRVKGEILTLQMRKMRFREVSWKMEYNKRGVNISLYYLKQKRGYLEALEENRIYVGDLYLLREKKLTLKPEQKECLHSGHLHQSDSHQRVTRWNISLYKELSSPGSKWIRCRT